MIKGVDISSYQGLVDFHSLKDNLDFVIIRSTYGNGYKDAFFERNRDGARAVGLATGFYHFAYPQYNAPEAEASWFTRTVSCKPGEILILDFEEPYGNPVDWCKRFLDVVSSNMGFKPLVYLNLSIINAHDWSPVINAGYGLWLAHYDGNPNQVDNTPWPVVAMKQFSDNGNIAGLTPVDMDSFYGDVATFKKYGSPAPNPVPDPEIPSSSVSLSTSPSASGSPSNPPSTISISPSEPPSPVPTKPSWITRFIQWLKALLHL